MGAGHQSTPDQSDSDPDNSIPDMLAVLDYELSEQFQKDAAMLDEIASSGRHVPYLESAFSRVSRYMFGLRPLRLHFAPDPQDHFNFAIQLHPRYFWSLARFGKRLGLTGDGKEIVATLLRRSFDNVLREALLSHHDHHDKEA